MSDLTKKKRIERLRQLESEIDLIRKQLKISKPGSIIYQAEIGWNYDLVIVEADGFGGATTMVVEGNYPIDYSTRSDRFFTKEVDAVVIADLIVSGGSSGIEILGASLS